MAMARNRRALLVAAWCAVFVAVAVQLLTGLRVESDLGAFMPRARTVAQAMLLNEIEAGPASRVWLLVISAETPSLLGPMNQRLAAELEASGQFKSVYSGQTALDDETQQILFRYRYLLDPDGGTTRFSVSALRGSLEAGLENLLSPVSPFEKQLLTADPTGSLRRIIETLRPPNQDPRSRDGARGPVDESQTFLLAESVADGTDLAAQERVAAVIETAFTAISTDSDAALVVTGPPVFAVAAKARIEREALTLSVGSAVVVISILLLVFGSVSSVLLISVPLAGAMLIATAVTTLIWGSIHGISLAFGATLLGVALDYPVHLIGHARPGERLAQSVPRVWPTLRLGVLTTVLGFTAMLTADFAGIQQLAVFSISGLLSAALLTRYLLVPMVVVPIRRAPRLRGVADAVGRSLAIAWWLPPVIIIAALALVWQEPTAVFASRIGALSPVPPNLVAQDRSTRASMGLGDPGYALLVRGATVETMLRRQEALRPILQQATDDELLRGYDMAALVLPSAARQRTRRNQLPDEETLRARIDQAREGLPYRPDAFRAFEDAVAITKQLPALNESAFTGTLLGTRLESLIRREADAVVGIVSLMGLSRHEAFEQRLRDVNRDGVLFIDIQGSTSDLVNGYRDDILVRSALALLFIAAVLAVALRDRGRWVRVLLPVLGSVLTAVAFPVLLGQSLNLFHLVSLLLVVGIGLDYALFFSRRSADALELQATRHSIFVCALSSVTVFAVLSLSQIPVLSSIGVTVATGAVSAFLLSAFMNRSNSYAEAKG